MGGRSRGEAALVAGLIFFGAGVAISSLVFGVLLVGGTIREGMDRHHAWPSWSDLVFVPPVGLFATAICASGALAVGVVLAAAAAAAALLRRVPFWAFLGMVAPCLLASHLQFAWAVNLVRSGKPSSPGYLPLAVLLPLFGSWLLLRRALPRTTPGRAG